MSEKPNYKKIKQLVSSIYKTWTFFYFSLRTKTLQLIYKWNVWICSQITLHTNASLPVGEALATSFNMEKSPNLVRWFLSWAVSRWVCVSVYLLVLWEKVKTAKSSESQKRLWTNRCGQTQGLKGFLNTRVVWLTFNDTILLFLLIIRIMLKDYTLITPYNNLP